MTPGHQAPPEPPRHELDGYRELLDLYDSSRVTEEDALCNRALDLAVELTGSTVGFFHRVAADGAAINLTTWNQKALRGCSAQRDQHYPIDQAGSWADFLRSGRPVVTNDYPTSAGRKGLPEGHVSILRFMSVPVFTEGRARYIFGVGNKAQPYDNDDLAELQLVADQLRRILARQAAEQALAASEHRYHSLMENMLAGVARCRMEWVDGRPVDWTYLEVNDAFVALTRLPVAPGRRVSELIPGFTEKNRELAERYGRVAAGGPAQAFEQYVATLDMWIEGNVLPAGPSEFFSIFNVITARKQAEADLVRGRAELAEAQRVAHIGSWTSARASGAVTWSTEVFRILGVQPRTGPIPASEQAGLIDPAASAIWNAAVARTMETGVAFEMETDLRRPDGSSVRVIAKGEAIRDTRGVIIGARGTIQDITERKANEEVLRQQGEDLRRQNEQLRRFNTVAVDRELRMIDLKQEVNALAARLGEPQRYRIAGDGDSPEVLAGPPPSEPTP